MKRIVLFSLLSLATTVNIQSKANAQVITTLAGGSRVAGFSGDGGAEFSATLNRPGGIFVDKIGNIYIADLGNYRIRKIDSSGIITTVAGNGGSGYSGDGGPATAAQLGPYDVCVDGAGNIYFGDFLNNVIRKIDTTGTISRIAGTGVAGYSGDTGPATDAQIDGASGVAVDTAGNIYFSDNSHRLRKINAAGTISTFCGTGISGFSGDTGPATLAKISMPGYMYIDNASYTLYFEDNNNNRIRKIDLATGIINTVAGNGVAGSAGDGGLATSAELNAPAGMTLDAAGNLYIVDDINNRIRVVNPSGIISAYAGTGVAGYSGDGGLATSAEFNLPIDVAIDAAGHLIMSDNINNRIRIIDNPCAGAPSGGKIHASPATACILPFVSALKVDSFSVTPGVTYYWQSSSDSINWATIPGAIGVSYAATVTTSPVYFRFVDSCTVSEDAGYAAIKLGLTPGSAGTISGVSGLCIDSNKILSDTTPGGTWSVYNGVASVSGSGVVHGLTAGLDIVSYTVINSCGTFSTTFPVTVYTPAQCDSILQVPTLGSNADDMKIYPNPISNGSFTVEMPGNQKVSISVINILGETVELKTLETNASKTIFDTKRFAPGTYFVKAVCADRTYLGKIVILQ